MTDGEYDNTSPVDFSDYEEWVNRRIGGASELPISYQPLTEENIVRLRQKSEQ